MIFSDAKMKKLYWRLMVKSEPGNIGGKHGEI